jgi:hypothetical protein
MAHFTVFDSDSHVVEPPELWEKYLDPEHRVLGKRALWRHHGETNSYLKVDGEVVRDTMNPNIPRHAIWRPGMTWDDVGALDAKVRHAMNPGAYDPRARLADMDKMGVDQAFLYPTWFAEGFPLISDPDTANALARAYNDWIADFCAADPRRLFAAAMLPLQDMDLALAELRRAAGNASFRGVFIRPMFVRDGYLTDPYYDPLWAEIEQLGLVAAVHPTPGLWNPEWTSHGPFRSNTIAGRRRWAILRRRRRTGEHLVLHRLPATGPSDGADPVGLAGQSHVRRLGADRLHGHAALPRHEGCDGAW